MCVVYYNMSIKDVICKLSARRGANASQIMLAFFFQFYPHNIAAQIIQLQWGQHSSLVAHWLSVIEPKNEKMKPTLSSFVTS